MRTLFISYLSIAFCCLLVQPVCAACGGDAFLNRDYRPECLRTLPDLDAPESITVREGKYESSPDMGALYFEVQGATCADLDGDGGQEAVVEAWCGYRGANYTLVEYLIFADPTGVDNAPPLTELADERIRADYNRFHPDSLVWNLQEVTIVDGELRAMFHADGPHCCPEKRVVMRYRLRQGALELVGDPLVEPMPR